MKIFTPNTIIASGDVNLNFSDLKLVNDNSNIYFDQQSAFLTKIPGGTFVNIDLSSVTITPTKNCKALITASVTIDRGSATSEEWDFRIFVNDNGGAFSSPITIYNINPNIQYFSMNISWALDLVAGHTYIIKSAAARANNATWVSRWGGIQVITQAV